MAMVIYNNMGAVRSLNTLNENTSQLAKALKKVSTGMRLNSASDGASEYSIGEKMEVMIRSLGQDIENAQTGRNLLQVAEGGIQEINDNIRDMKEMAIDAANDTNTDADRATIQKVFSERMREIADIAATTNYNGRLLLNGDYSEFSFIEEAAKTIPASSGGTIPNTLDDLIGSFSPASSWTTESTSPRTYPVDMTANKNYVCAGSSDPTFDVAIDFSSAKREDGSTPSCPSDFDQQGFSVLCGGCAQFVNIKFDASTSKSTYNPKASTSYMWAREYVIGIADITSVSDLPKAVFEGIKNAVGRTTAALEGCYLDSSGSILPGSDFPPTYYKAAAKDSADGNSIAVDGEHNLRIVKTGDSYAFQRDNGPVMGIAEGVHETDSLPDPLRRGLVGTPLIIHTGPKQNQYLPVFINSMHPIAMGLNRAGVNPRERALQALGIVDRALEYALNENTRMGAYQVRLSETEGTLVTREENTTASMSILRDTDMAKEMVNYTKANVLAQSAQSMLAQSQQNVGSVLDLLQ